MKTTKFMTLALMALAIMASAGDFDLYEQVTQAKRDRATNETAQAFLDGLTDAQWLQFADQYIATNAILHQADGKPHGIIPLAIGTTDESNLGWKISMIGFRRGNKIALCDEYDQKFAAAGFADWFVHDGLSSYYPKVHQHYIDEGVNTNVINRQRALYHTSMSRHDTIDENGTYRNWTIPERINRLVNFRICGWYSISKNDETLKQITRDSLREIKRKLREKGISFVVKEGDVNPVQEAIDVLTSAFQAPKLAGVKEWVAEWYPDYQWVDLDDLFMSDADMTKLCDDIYYGEVDLTNSNSVKILAHLGLDAYNAFIKRYNGEQ